MKKSILCLSYFLCSSFSLVAQIKCYSFSLGSKHYVSDSSFTEVGLKKNEDVTGANKSAILVDKVFKNEFNTTNKLVKSTAASPITDIQFRLESMLWLYDNTRQNKEEEFHFLYVCGHGATSKYNTTPYFFPGNAAIRKMYKIENNEINDIIIDPASNYLVAITPFGYDSTMGKGIIFGDFCQSFFETDSSLTPSQRVEKVAQYSGKQLTKSKDSLLNNYAQQAVNTPKVDVNDDLIKQMYGDSLAKTLDQSQIDEIKRAMQGRLDTFTQSLYSEEYLKTMGGMLDTLAKSLSNPYNNSDYNQDEYNSLLQKQMAAHFHDIDYPMIISSPPGEAQETVQNPTSKNKFSKVGPLGRRIYLASEKLKNEAIVTLELLVNTIMDPELDELTAESLPVLYWNGKNKDLILRKR